MQFRIARRSSIQNPAATLAESCAVFIMRSRCILLDTGLGVEERSAIPAPYAVLIHGAQVAPPGLLELTTISIYLCSASVSAYTGRGGGMPSCPRRASLSPP